MTGPGQPHGVEYVADNASHYYCFYHNITGSERAPYHDAMAYLDAATDMSDTFTSTCGIHTDIMYLENPNLDTQFGIAVCVRVKPGTTSICDAFWVATNFGAIPPFMGPNSAPLSVQENLLIRHETGHTVGLHHSASTVSAMKLSVAHDLGRFNFLWALYSSDHINHINGFY